MDALEQTVPPGSIKPQSFMKERATPLKPSLMEKARLLLTKPQKRAEIVQEYLRKTSEIQNPKIRLQSIVNLLKSKEIDQSGDYIVDAINYAMKSSTSAKPAEKTQFELSIANQVLHELGLESHTLLKLQAIMRSKDYSVLQNVRAMVELEHEKPGIVKLLIEDFGIAFFARYPKEALKQQIAEGLLVGDPYVLMIYSRADWNGAFRDPDEIRKIFKQTRKHKVPLRIIETDNREELEQLLTSLRERFGEHQASLLIIAAHGTTTTIQLGQSVYLNEQNLEGTTGDQLYLTCLGGAEAVMWACSTGKSFARTLSLKIAGKAIGPQIPAPSSEVKLLFGRDKIARIKLADYQYVWPERFREEFRYASDYITTAWRMLTQKAPSAEYIKGNLQTKTSLHELLRKAKLTDEEREQLKQIALHSVGGDNVTALYMLARYTAVANKESGERRKILSNMADIGLYAHDEVTRYQAFLALRETLIYFMSDPEIITCPNDFADPSQGSEQLILARDIDADSALWTLDAIDNIIRFKSSKREMEGLRQHLQQAKEEIQSSSALPGKEKVLLRLSESAEKINSRRGELF